MCDDFTYSAFIFIFSQVIQQRKDRTVFKRRKEELNNGELVHIIPSQPLDQMQMQQQLQNGQNFFLNTDPQVQHQLQLPMLSSSATSTSDTGSGKSKKATKQSAKNSNINNNTFLQQQQQQQLPQNYAFIPISGPPSLNTIPRMFLQPPPFILPNPPSATSSSTSTSTPASSQPQRPSFMFALPIKQEDTNGSPSGQQQRFPPFFAPQPNNAQKSTVDSPVMPVLVKKDPDE